MAKTGVTPIYENCVKDKIVVGSGSLATTKSKLGKNEELVEVWDTYYFSERQVS